VVASRSGKEPAEDDEARNDGGFEQNNLEERAVHRAAVYRRGTYYFITTPSHGFDKGVMLISPAFDVSVSNATTS